MAGVVPLCLLPLLIGGLCLVGIAEGLTVTHCRSRSGHCWPTPARAPTTTTTTSDHHSPQPSSPLLPSCPARGHFPHPGGTRLYYRCHEVGARACTCRCRYEGMCFSSTTRRCEFSFLPEIHNCSSAIAATAATADTTRGTTPEGARDHKDMLVLLANAEHIHRLNEPLQPARQVAPRSFAARQSGPRDPGTPRDHVPFPIWAVAIVALSLLVMLVLIIVLMYNNNVDYL